MNFSVTNTEKRQFRVLYRQFLFRVVDAELMSASADPQKLLGQMATALLSVSILASLPAIFAGGELSPTRLRIFAHFFIATTMLVVGLFSVLSWDAVFPDRRDVLVLAPLPLRTRTVFLAKMAAIAVSLGVAICALNGISGLLWPLFLAPNHSFLGELRSFVAFWMTLIAAALFVFGATLVLQGAASQLLPRQLFLRLSAVLQVTVFCVLISVYVLEPSLESSAAMLAPQNHPLLAWLPSYWFFAFFEKLGGSHAPEFVWLARRAWIALAAVAGGAVITVLLSYVGAMRRAVEQPDILPGSRRRSLPFVNSLGSSVDRAILRFAVRTILRSRQHRMILSFYMGTGFGVVLILLRPALVKRGDIAVPLLAASVLMLITAAAAMRTVISMPIALKANWIFRVAALESVARYTAAIRRVFLLAFLAIWSCFAVVMLWLWPWRMAVAHLLMLALLGSILADLCLLGARKIPFTCSYRPGRANMQFAVWGALVLLPLTLIGSEFAWRSLHTLRGQIVYSWSLLLPAIALRWWSVREAARSDTMQFEDHEEQAVITLDLGPDLVTLRLPVEPVRPG